MSSREDTRPEERVKKEDCPCTIWKFSKDNSLFIDKFLSNEYATLSVGLQLSRVSSYLCLSAPLLCQVVFCSFRVFQILPFQNVLPRWKRPFFLPVALRSERTSFPCIQYPKTICMLHEVLCLKQIIYKCPVAILAHRFRSRFLRRFTSDQTRSLHYLKNGFGPTLKRLKNRLLNHRFISGERCLHILRTY